jgi:hypothetical protein
VSGKDVKITIQASEYQHEGSAVLVCAPADFEGLNKWLKELAALEGEK